MRENPIGWGEAAPWFNAPTPHNPNFIFSSLGGRFVCLVFLGHAELADAQAFMAGVAAAGLQRDDARYVAFAVSNHGEDLANKKVAEAFPPGRVFHDQNWNIANQYGLLRVNRETGNRHFTQAWYILDPTLRVYRVGRLSDIEGYISAVRGLPEAAAHSGASMKPWAPVLMVPRVLEPAFCQQLIRYYNNGQPRQSGFMQSVGGKTVGRLDPSFKRRSDVEIEDEELRAGLRYGLTRRVLPEIEKAFQFKATRIERYIVACYDGQEGGFFKAHRDNTTPGTAHRRFAVTINLNAEDYEGGELTFPEYGPTRYKAPTGGAVVFSCSLLHEASPVTRGLRYATLPFLYDDAAAEIRQANLSTIENAEDAIQALP